MINTIKKSANKNYTDVTEKWINASLKKGKVKIAQCYIYNNTSKNNLKTYLYSVVNLKFVQLIGKKKNYAPCTTQNCICTKIGRFVKNALR